MNKLIVFKIFFLIVFMHNHINAQEVINKSNQTEKMFTIENCVSTFSMNETSKTNVGYQFWFVDKDFLDGRTLKMSVVSPHKSTHAPHKHVEDEFFFVLEGAAKFYLDGKSTIVGPLTSLYCPSNIEHGISNVGDTELKYLVIKKYQIKVTD